jgi:hypothetical protein
VAPAFKNEAKVFQHKQVMIRHFIFAKAVHTATVTFHTDPCTKHVDITPTPDPPQVAYNMNKWRQARHNSTGSQPHYSQSFQKCQYIVSPQVNNIATAAA